MFKKRKNKFLIGLFLSVAMLLGSFLLSVPKSSYAVTLDQVVDKLGAENALKVFASINLLTRLSDEEIAFLVDLGRKNTKEYLYLVAPGGEEILGEMGIIREEFRSILQAFQTFVHNSDDMKNLRNGISEDFANAAEDMANQIIGYLSPEVKSELKKSDEEIIRAVLEINRYVVDSLKSIGKMGEAAVNRIISGNPNEADKAKLAALGVSWEDLQKVMACLSSDEKDTFKGIVLKLAIMPGSGSPSKPGGGPDSAVIFTDINGHWAQAEIEFMYNKGFVKGTGDKKFTPDAPITRAEFAALLQRVLGISENAASSGFIDLKGDAWYTSAINAVAYAKLIMGYPDGNFRPWGKISRQEMAVMVVRALAYSGQDQNLTQAEIEEMLAKFEDQVKIGSWAREAAAKAIDTGLVQGRSENKWAPLDTATRAEGVVMVKSLLVKMGKI